MSQTYIETSLFKGYDNFFLWVPLLFTGFYFFPLSIIWEKLSLVEVMLSFIAYFVFIGVYIQAQKATQRTIVHFYLSLSILAFAVTYLNPGSCALYPYISFLIGFYHPFKKGLAWLSFLMITIGLSAWLFNLIEMYYLLPAYIASIPNYFFGSMERLKIQHEYEKDQSQEQNEQLATIAERERIARDLHDLLGHTLSSIVLKAELANKLGKAGQIDSALNEISQVADITRTTLSEVREAVSGYKSKDMDAEFDTIKNRLLDKGFDVDCDLKLSNLRAKAESSIVLIIKEAATNIIKHSDGNHVLIKAKQNTDELNLLIKNDGHVKSFNMGNGLSGIQERVQELGGLIKITNENGFCLDISFNKSVFSS